MNREENITEKIRLIKELLFETEYDALRVESQANFSFITGGRGFIGLASTKACGELLITRNQVYLISENIENDRLFVEQIKGHPLISKRSYPWDQPNKKEQIIKELTTGLKVATEEDVSQEIFYLRTVMNPYDCKMIEKLSYESANILEAICKKLTPGITDYELAGEISKALWKRNIEPITILIGFDERAYNYRHPVMNGAVLKNYALVSICARRNGVISSLSRNVLISSDQEIIKKHEKCARVYANFLESLKIGKTLGEGYRKIEKIYEDVGYPKEEKLHHQGGLTGFIPRELKTTSDANHLIRERELYAFNPTLQGAKVEETVLVTKDGILTLTNTDKYEYVEITLNEKMYKIPTVYVINRENNHKLNK